MARALEVAVFVVLILSIIQASYVLTKTSDAFEPHLQARATEAIVSICFDRPLTIDISACATTFNQSTTLVNNTYTCTINATDPDGNTPNFSVQTNSTNGLNFSIHNTTGLITADANQTAVGMQSRNLVVTDNTCSRDYIVAYNFSVTDINDPPYLKVLIPSKRVTAGSTLAAFFLNDYFDDPDGGDILTYNVTGNANFAVTINTATSSVLITAPASFCGTENVYFNATDPGGLTEDSNIVTLESICTSNTPPTSSSGGGGGGSICEPIWRCERWSSCSQNNTRSRRCVDIAGCDPDQIEKIFYENCTYLEEPETEPPKEPKTQEPIPTCMDGIKNQAEIGVDCGGPCPACKQVELPVIIPVKDNRLVSLIMIILIALATLFLVYVVFRKEIRSMLAKIGWLLTRHRAKQILLTENEKTEMLSAVSVLEKEFALKKNMIQFMAEDQLVQEILRMQRHYFKCAFDTTFEYTEADIDMIVEKQAVNVALKSALKLFAKRQSLLETAKLDISRMHVATLIEEMRQIIINTSRATKEDVMFAMREAPVAGTPISKIGKLMYNSMIALAYQEIAVAQKYYFQLIALYEELEESQKELVYEDTAKLYHYIKYILSWA